MKSIVIPDFSVEDFPKQMMLSFRDYRDHWPYVKSQATDLTKGDEALETSFITDVWSLHPEMSISELVPYIYDLMTNQKIGLFNNSSEFEFMWKYTVTMFREEGAVLDDSEAEFVKNGIKFLEESTYTESMKEIVSFRKLYLAMKFLGDQTCPKCGESSWNFLELSPNMVSAKFQCSFCEKIVLVKKNDDVKTSENSNGRYIPKQAQREVWRRDRGQCVECGTKENIEFDHIIPVSKGGSNTTRNIQLLCQECNSKKSDKDPGDY